MAKRRLNLFLTIGTICIVWLGTCATYAYWLQTRFDPWNQGDWLINYAGGFVRRGVVGAVALEGPSLGASPTQVVVGLQVVLLGSLCMGVAWLFSRTDQSSAWMMVVLSPATMLFPLLNPEGAFRKELIPLNGLMLLAIASYSKRPRLISLVAGILFVIGIFAHEGMVLTIPCAMIIANRIPNLFPTRIWRRTVLAAAAAIAIAITLGNALSPGSTSQVEAICSSWKKAGIAQCDGGALSSLLITREDSQALLITLYPNYLWYSVAVLGSLAPLFVIGYLPSRWKDVLIAYAAMIPLFFTVWDYGRWIYIAAMCSMFLALARGTRIGLISRKISLPIVVVFISIWGFSWFVFPSVGTPMNRSLVLLIHNGGDQIDAGKLYLDRFSTIRNFK